MTFQTPKANGNAASYLLEDMVMQIALNVLDSSWGVQPPPPLSPNPARCVGNYTAVGEQSGNEERNEEAEP